MSTTPPLAERMRPKSLEDFAGQPHLVGHEGVVTKMLENGQLGSMILWGPPGVGKTTLARLIAKASSLPFFQLSAIQSGVKEIRQIIDASRKTGKALLFIDEIHRFNKSQQDALLGAVEEGSVLLIGATTENPSFEVISALLSRCQVFTLSHHTAETLQSLLTKALTDDKHLQKMDITLQETDALLRYSGGDARKLYNILEMAIGQSSIPVKVNNQLVEKSLLTQSSIYDKGGEMHYDVISAFIKSVRGSDPDAAVYWLARMLNAGEDVKFIARRLIILASEDIGLANPTALVIANNSFHAVNAIGMPEARIVLSQATIYLANSPQSNSAYLAINQAMAEAKKQPNAPVPLHLRNAPTKLLKSLNYGKDYQYVHDHPGNFVQQSYLPKGMEHEVYYKPADNPRERDFGIRLSKLWPKKKR